MAWRRSFQRHRFRALNIIRQSRDVVLNRFRHDQFSPANMNCRKDIRGKQPLNGSTRDPAELLRGFIK
jgi:hypothetical protein